METERLYFSKVSLREFDSMFSIFGDSDVMKYWLGGADKDLDSMRQRIIEIIKHWNTHNFGDFIIHKKSNSEIIGFGGLHFISDMVEVNIGYAFKKSVWRNGFAFEACKEILRYGFNELKFPQIVAVIWPDNIPSINLIRKCGFQYWKNIIWSGSERVVYSLKP